MQIRTVDTIQLVIVVVFRRTLIDILLHAVGAETCNGANVEALVAADASDLEKALVPVNVGCQVDVALLAQFRDGTADCLARHGHLFQIEVNAGVDGYQKGRYGQGNGLCRVHLEWNKGVLELG